jgi:hypothetical protein
MTAALTPANAANLAKTLKPAVDLVLITKAKAEILREEIDALDAKLLAEREYRIAAEWVKQGDADERITEPKNTWLMGDEDAAIFHRLRADAIEAAGYEVPTREFCPALIAESAERDAIATMIELATTMPGLEHMTGNRVLCGTKDKNGLDFYREYTDLLIKIVVNAPGGYTNPLERLAA